MWVEFKGVSSCFHPFHISVEKHSLERVNVEKVGIVQGESRQVNKLQSFIKV